MDPYLFDAHEVVWYNPIGCAPSLHVDDTGPEDRFISGSHICYAHCRYEGRTPIGPLSAVGT